MKRLLIRPGAIGDFIVSLPALESLQSDYTEVWCRSDVIPLVQFADRCVSLVGSGIDRVGLVEAGGVIARLGYFDEIHSWYGTNSPEFRDCCRHLPFRFYSALPPDGPQHAIDFYLAQVGQSVGATPRIRVEEQAREAYAVLHPFSGSAGKNWPIEKWRELATLLEPRMPVLWCRGPEDDLAGAVAIPNLLHLAQWLSGARVFIGNDSGVTHLAAAVGTPVIVVFAKTNPNVWAPRGADVTICYHNEAAKRVAEAVP